MAVASCEPLDNVDKNVCGNRVFEPDTGEDCDGNPETDPVDTVDAGDAGDAGDTSAKRKTRCGSACRYVCNLADDPTVACPAEFGCGIDGTCRKPGGLSASPLSIAGGGVRRLLSGDFDGDGRQDAVAIDDSSLDILFFETNGLIDQSLNVPNDRRLPGIGDIDGDGTSDLILNLGNALGVLTGQDNRTLLPRSYPSGDVDLGTVRLLPLGRLDEDNMLLAFVTNAGQTTLEARVIGESDEADSTPPPKQVGPSFSGTLAGVAFAPAKTPTACPLIAFALAAPTPAMYVLTCQAPKKLAEEPTFIPISLPAGASLWTGVFFADADGDGDDDLLVGLVDSTKTEGLHLYRNEGNGTFLAPMPAPTYLEPLSVFDPESCLGRTLGGPPLAVGDFDVNGALDVIDARGVLYNPFQPSPDDTYTRDCMKIPAGVKWGRAVFGDFNGDKLPDLLAAREKQTLLDVWSRVEGGELKTFTIPVEEIVGEFAVGDFDGDSVDDAVLRLVPPAAPNGQMSSGPSELLMLFGRPLAVPEAPLSLGVFEGLEHIAAGRVKGKNAVGAPDLLDDLVVLSVRTSDMAGMPGMPGMTSPTKHFTIVEGNVGRRLLAPLTIKPPPGQGMELSNSADGPTQIVVSRFGVEECKAPSPPDETEEEETVTPSTIVARTASKIWLAGCSSDGSSLPVLEGLDAMNGSMLIAPVNYDQRYDAVHDALAIFMDAPGESQGLWVNDYRAGQFDPLPNPIPAVAHNLVLPDPDPFNVPSLVVDVDGNGQRDVVVLVQKRVPQENGNPITVRSAVAIFWNDGSGKDPVNAKNMTLAADLSDDYFGPDMATSNADTEELRGIIDIALLNTNATADKELAVLTRGGLYVFSFDAKTRKFIVPERLPGQQPPAPFSRLFGGQALLAIDANSDGVDDLLVAEGQKLLLFLGKEIAR
ncbi:FG-GAP repeat domain-containing protein [Polyangium fumosum]|uniref:VCBS repeat-containing protein n=1 Tax=Polyangium fumosum TaxID=889272 RepID=A0A4U1JA36_9BACT|nr:VCBS repeat-containing protein [Polyangium fumosum]TKD03500.1 VCBS repeat-containing protein [Polyangium fumosum]